MQPQSSQAVVLFRCRLGVVPTLALAITGALLFSGCSSRPLPRAGQDVFETKAKIEVNGQSVDFSGPAGVERKNPVGRQVSTEMACMVMQNSSGSVLLVAGAGAEAGGKSFDLTPVKGTITSLRGRGGFPARSDFEFPPGSFKVATSGGTFCNETGVTMQAESIESVPPIGTTYVAGQVTQTTTYRDCCTGVLVPVTTTKHLQHEVVDAEPAPPPPLKESGCCVTVASNATGAGKVGVNVVRGGDCGKVVFGGEIPIATGKTAAQTATELSAAIGAAIRTECDCDVELNDENTFTVTCRALETLSCCLAGTDVTPPGKNLNLSPVPNLGQTFTESQPGECTPFRRSVLIGCRGFERWPQGEPQP